MHGLTSIIEKQTIKLHVQRAQLESPKDISIE